MMTVCACLWLGLFPLLHFGTYSTITYNKWTFMLLLTCLTLLGVIFRKKKPLNPSARVPAALAAALGGWIVFSCLVSPYPAMTWLLGASVRLEGLVSQLCYLALFFAFASGRVRRQPVLLAAAAGAAVFFAVVLLQRSGVNAMGLYPRGKSYERAREFQGTIGNIDMDTGYLCLLSALFLTEAVSRLSAFFRRPSGASPRLSALAYPACLTAALALCVYLIVTMDVQFGTITLAFLAVLTLFRRIPPARRIPALLILAAVAAAAVWFWPAESGGIWELREILQGRTLYSFGSNRLGVWIYSLRLAPRRLMTGGGSDTFVLRFNAFMQQNGFQLPTSQGGIPLGTYFDAPHNEYIAHLINHGLPAMVLFISLILSAAFRRPAPGASPACQDRLRLLSPWGAAVLCYAVQAFFSFSVPLVAPMFWVVLGICAGEVPEKAEKGSSASPPRR